MKVSKEELVAVLAQFNPWWRGEAVADLPGVRRAAFRELQQWMLAPPAPRAVLLSGARQIGKTTLLLQASDALLRSGVPAANVLYAVAVGTPVARRPPHRSVRAALPHTAPA
jgi:hypothetical protein